MRSKEEVLQELHQKFPSRIIEDDERPFAVFREKECASSAQGKNSIQEIKEESDECPFVFPQEDEFMSTQSLCS